MAERIDQATQPPPMRLSHGEDLLSTCQRCLREHRIRIRHGHHHPHGRMALYLRRGVVRLRGFATEPGAPFDDVEMREVSRRETELSSRTFGTFRRELSSRGAPRIVSEELKRRERTPDDRSRDDHIPPAAAL
jgi:hypothetical protein